jgi:leucyl/phenylalanyl-tRNA--protein transferase
MPVFRLPDHPEFPPAWLARPDGLLCIGGDLSAKRLILAYEKGIFPWFSKDEPLLWWSPDPRLVLFPESVHISRSLRKKIKKNIFEVRINTCFNQTIMSCAKPRKNKNEGTWLVPEMIDAYMNLHELGYAHSIETYRNGRLAGGLYGVCLGGSFFGESMFSLEKDASKIALVFLATYLESNDFDLIDCQVTSSHLITMGAVEIPRNSFLDIIANSVKRRDIKKNIWAKGTRIEIKE